MTDEEIIRAQDTAIKKLSSHIRRLKKRLLEKKKYEIEFLRAMGASVEYLAKIEIKDQAALAD